MDILLVNKNGENRTGIFLNVHIANFPNILIDKVLFQN